MRIRRFTGVGVRETLETIRAAVGPKAVILSTQQLPDGSVEIVAGVERAHYALPDAVQRVAAAALGAAHASHGAAPLAATARAASGLRSALRPALIRQPAAGAGTAAPVPEPGAPDGAVPGIARDAVGPEPGLHQDLQELRRTLELFLAGLKRNAAARRDPHAGAMADALRALRVADDVIDGLLPDAATSAIEPTLAAPGPDPVDLLVRGLTFDARSPTEVTGRLALVGPPGAGKTTTVAKLAALAVARGGPGQVAIVAAADHHVGGGARLDAYARLLGVAVHRFATPTGLAPLLETLAERPLVLIDGAGLEPGEPQFDQYLRGLHACAGLEPLLALPATASEPTLERAVRAYAPLAPQACVLTRLDAAAGLGDVLSVSLRHGLRCVWGTDGQRVPADIHALTAADLVGRLERAMAAPWELPRVAERVGGVVSHATAELLQ